MVISCDYFMLHPYSDFTMKLGCSKLMQVSQDGISFVCMSKLTRIESEKSICFKKNRHCGHTKTYDGSEKFPYNCHGVFSHESSGVVEQSYFTDVCFPVLSEETFSYNELFAFFVSNAAILTFVCLYISLLLKRVVVWSIYGIKKLFCNNRFLVMSSLKQNRSILGYSPIHVE